MKKYALISVSNKTNLLNLVSTLAQYNYTIIATSGTEKFLKINNYECVGVAEFNDFPEILNGRVKTLHPKIFAGLLADRNDTEHLKELEKYNIPLIDLLVCNLYDFENFINNNKDGSLSQIIENIDIGGVGLIRAAAKNFENVVVLSNPEQYKEFTIKLKNNDIDLSFRKKLAIQAFQLISCYDFVISNYLRGKIIDSNIVNFTETITDLSYGENPHQSAFLINTVYDKYSIHQLYGPAISYNNILDINAGLRLLENFENDFFCAVFKHSGPCGAALGVNMSEAYIKANKSDPVSAYGGVVVFNNIVDAETARFVIKNFTEVVLAPDFTIEAQRVFAEKKKTRLILYYKKNKNYKLEYKSTFVGVLFQETDFFALSNEVVFNNVTNTPVSDKKRLDIIFGLKIVKAIKSNAIVLVNNNMVIGIGGCQPNRINSVRLAIHNAKKYGHDIDDAVLISDGFFPFSDSIEFIKDYNIKTVVQPGGSKRDQDIIDTCNKYNISMILTGRRHFYH
ncbi:MAG TPA: bifunctional phosphoribosylaminoimidazolecarboxamide formyltransferase/IMP cyclohydrolase [bacterium]|nr:bifunctional phosphoribosylaminoimidazolecarboxamide formyltransferase/IMP cyclohydrolase [bacterium]